MASILDYRRLQPTIDKWIEDKEKNEIKMAAEIQEELQRRPLLNIMQAIAKAAITELLHYSQRDPLLLHNYLKNDKSRFWNKKRTKARGMAQDANRLAQFERLSQTPIPMRQESKVGLDAGDCADILRLYAEFAEKCGEGDPKFAKVSKEFANAVGIKGTRWTHYSWLMARRKIRGEEKILRDEKSKKDQMRKGLKVPGWKRPPSMAEDFFQGIKYRWDGAKRKWVTLKEGEEKEPSGKDVRLRKLYSKNPIDRLRDAVKQVLLYEPGLDPQPGALRWKLHPYSAIYQLDRMFGKPEGADISGTTADTLFGIEALFTYLVDKLLTTEMADWLEDILNIKPLIALLPLASMVSRGHHTTLECAMVLTLNDYINYSVGYYTTLFPEAYIGKGGKRPDFSNNEFRVAYDRIYAVLAKYEELNKPMMVYFDYDPGCEGKRLGVIDFTGDKAAAMPLFTLRENLFTYMPICYSKEIIVRNPTPLVISHTLLMHKLERLVSERKASGKPYIQMTADETQNAITSLASEIEKKRNDPQYQLGQNVVQRLKFKPQAKQPAEKKAPELRRKPTKKHFW